MSNNISIDSETLETNKDNEENTLKPPEDSSNEKVKDNEAGSIVKDHVLDNGEIPLAAAMNSNECDNRSSIINGDHNDELIQGTKENDDKANEPEEIAKTSTTENNQVNGVVNNSLSLLAQYTSEDSSSSSDGSSSESESSDTSSKSSGMDVDSADSESSVSSIHSQKSLNTIKKKLDEFQDADDDDDDPDAKLRRTPIKAIGELGIEDLPPIEDLHITVPETECNLLGKITSIVDQLVLVESLPNAVPLDLDTVLFLDKGQRPLGKIFDVLGQVHCPIYCIRFNTNQEIQEKGIQVGNEVYCAPSAPCTQIVILPELMKHKGSDASWKNDIEPPPRFVEYSDDEEERNARKSRSKVRAPPHGSEEQNPVRNGHHGHPGDQSYQYQRARRGNHHHSNYNRENSHHSSFNYPRPNHHQMPLPNHMHHQPQYYYPPPGPATGVYPNPFAQPDPRYYVNPFAYAPTVNYPPFNPNLFNGPPPPPPEN
uniref:H/ACA ribonucleoprotein complex non-core subunit NAF1 n=1 Tax=Culicoides sonorensis TaxID=179676 RepID=A0A336KDR8_CULSO